MDQLITTFLPQFLPNMDLLQFVLTSKLVNKTGNSEVYSRIPSDYTCKQAAKDGKIEILKWLRSQDPPCPWDEGCWNVAAQYGNTETLRWLKEKNCPRPTDYWPCLVAIENGYLETVKWLRAQEPPFPWNLPIIPVPNEEMKTYLENNGYEGIIATLT